MWTLSALNRLRDVKKSAAAASGDAEYIYLKNKTAGKTGAC